jgi:hypothetical protein
MDSDVGTMLDSPLETRPADLPQALEVIYGRRHRKWQPIRGAGVSSARVPGKLGGHRRRVSLGGSRKQTKISKKNQVYATATKIMNYVD